MTVCLNVNPSHSDIFLLPHKERIMKHHRMIDLKFLDVITLIITDKDFEEWY
jgi:hypothetical protein